MKVLQWLRRRGLAVTAAAVLLVCCLPLSAGASSVSALESKIKELEKEASSWAAKIKDSRSEKEDAEVQKNYLDRQIDSVQKQIDLLDDEVTALNRQISQKNKQIDAKEKAIDKQEAAIRVEYEQVRACVRGIAKRGTGTELQFLLSTETYADYLLKSKMMERISESEQETLNSLEKELSGIEAEKTALQKDKTELQADKASTQAVKKKVQAKQAELDTLYTQSKRLVAQLESTIAAYKAKQKALQKEMDKLEDQISALQHTDTTQSYKTGKMYWPCPGVTTITSRYGMRWGRLHKGTDIAGHNAYGKSIVAAADGVVTVSAYHSSYGNYVIVDHGYDSSNRRIMTLYAHMSRRSVSVGASVKGGSTVLGKIGSTGNSTGPHLHFEVRINGTPVDAIAKGYIRVP